MKNIKLNFLALASLLIFSTSCEDDQEYNVTTNAPVGTFSADKTSVVETDNPITPEYENLAICNFTMDRPYKTNMSFKVELVASESTGTAEDFEFNLPASGIDNGPEGYLLKVDKNQTNKVFTFTAKFDNAADAVETFKFKITPIADFNGSVAPSSEYFTMTIGNSTSDNLDIIFDWGDGKSYVGVDEDDHNYNDFDFDLEIRNAADITVLSSYSSAPEAIEFLSTYPNGTYTIVASFWDAAPAAEPMLPINFTPTVTVTKKGIFEKTFDLSGIWDSAVGGNEQGNPDAFVAVAYFTKTGSTFQLYDMNDNLLVSGKSGAVKSAIKSISSASKGGRK